MIVLSTCLFPDLYMEWSFAVCAMIDELIIKSFTNYRLWYGIMFGEVVRLEVHLP